MDKDMILQEKEAEVRLWMQRVAPFLSAGVDIHEGSFSFATAETNARDDCQDAGPNAEAGGRRG